MDILEPELIWVNNSCYRVFDRSNMSDIKELPAYEEEIYEPYDSNDDEFNCELIEIVQDTGNRYKHSFHVNSHFYRFIIGSKGATLKRLAADTNTQIHVPRLGQNGDVVITGINQKDIKEARYRIDLLIETSRKKLKFTHFIGIPANVENVIKNFKKFKEDVLKTCTKGAREITEELFQVETKLHLTIVMLLLLDENDRKKATDALKACEKNIIPILEKNGPLTIELKGVECMNDDPSETRVVYIKTHDATGCLQQISNKIADYFIDNGLARKTYDQVKLHLTVMNSRYSTKLDSFDATNILKNHKDTYFGKLNLSTIHLSQRHTISNDGYYQATAKIDLLNS